MNVFPYFLLIFIFMTSCKTADNSRVSDVEGLDTKMVYVVSGSTIAFSGDINVYRGGLQANFRSQPFAGFTVLGSSPEFTKGILKAGTVHAIKSASCTFYGAGSECRFYLANVDENGKASGNANFFLETKVMPGGGGQHFETLSENSIEDPTPKAKLYFERVCKSLQNIKEITFVLHEKSVCRKDASDK